LSLTEVHEQIADCDLLMPLLHHIHISRPDLGVVLMSATLDVEKLTCY